jgi:hypothetical protein
MWTLARAVWTPCPARLGVDDREHVAARAGERQHRPGQRIEAPMWAGPRAAVSIAASVRWVLGSAAEVE